MDDVRMRAMADEMARALAEQRIREWDEWVRTGRPYGGPSATDPDGILVAKPGEVFDEMVRQEEKRRERERRENRRRGRDTMT